MSPLMLTIIGSVAAPLAVGAAFRAVAGNTPADKRATYNAMTHAAFTGVAWYLSNHKGGTAQHLARGAMFGEGAAVAFALAGPQILNATGAAKFAGVSHDTMRTMRRYYGLE